MATIGYVRVLGDNHALHRAGAVLAVTDNPAITNPQTIYRHSADRMIAMGQAEWIRGAASSADDVRTSQQRYLQERAKLTERHLAEHRSMMARHNSEDQAAAALATRQFYEHSRMLARQADAYWSMEADGRLHERAALTAQRDTEHGAMMARYEAEYESPETRAARHFNEHRTMLARQAEEYWSINIHAQDDVAATN